jgi:hypothetical protein
MNEPSPPLSVEAKRLSDSAQAEAWRKWGPYLADRAWGTVREDYSPTGDAWNYFPHDVARSRAYRWSEDGLGGICDEKQILCLAFAFWNGRDPILKERLFGLTNQEGNHGEDVKEYYFHLDNTPTHSYMKMLYRYPHAEFPYRQLVEINRHRGPDQPEYELVDTGVLAENAFCDIFIEYAKADPGQILCRLTVCNRGSQEAGLHVLPTLWFRNTWSWSSPPGRQPIIRHADPPGGGVGLAAEHAELGLCFLYAREAVETWFTFNETNQQRLFGVPNAFPAVKDAFHEYLVNNQPNALHQNPWGTKAALPFHFRLAAGGQQSLELVLSERRLAEPFADFSTIFQQRLAEADAFYQAMLPATCDPNLRRLQRQALAGLLWTKQFYHYNVDVWLRGDSACPPPPQRRQGRNAGWRRLAAEDVVVMPDKWEYPWFGAWDWAFHCLTLGYVDIALAKSQLELIVSERYQNLSGQLPAYEWAFNDANPPLQALAAWRVYNMEKRRNGGHGDRGFLERIYHKLLLNFVWWVNRKDERGHNVFEGGFLGLDNISVFDRSRPLPNGQMLEQADATGWMGLFCLNMMTIGLELAQQDPAYSHLALKFFDHFLVIAQAINTAADGDVGLWDGQDGFYYDKIICPQRHCAIPLRVRSSVGLIPLYAVQVLEKSWFEHLPAFQQRWASETMQRAIREESVGCTWSADRSRCLLSIANRHRLERVLARVTDENEFLSPFGVRSLSRYHLEHPYQIGFEHQEWTVRYEPAESHSTLFGGNSNWRGPIWFPIAYLLITALRSYHRFYGEAVQTPRPGRPGERMNLLELSEELARRMISIFLPDGHGRRPVFGGQNLFQNNPLWKDLVPFHEYFHGDSGAGLGASHQTGWTALLVQMIDYVTRGYQRSGG